MAEHPRCINCLACVEACPRGLLPNILFHAILHGADEAEEAAIGLLRCGLCHACKSRCPVGLPLGDVFAATRAGLGKKESTS
ncbi:MAG TPA: 4Fe-4S dicluster domain-containing protein [Candidatus Ozemobacteraceae bacterium]|nr:4Fe-4S dicluster domain-containing protein [Candidatus Ozemobacteraceae bacterium]